MLVIIDGVDLTGKSRLAEALSRLCRPSAPIQAHRGPVLTESSYREYVRSVDWYRPGLDDLIVDRSFPSEFVWSRIWGRGTDMDMREVERCAAALEEKGAVHVHARRQHKPLVQAFAAADEPLATDRVAEAVALYDQLYRNLSRRGHAVLNWDFDRMDESVIHEIAVLARQRAKEAA